MDGNNSIDYPSHIVVLRGCCDLTKGDHLALTVGKENVRRDCRNWPSDQDRPRLHERLLESRKCGDRKQRSGIFALLLQQILSTRTAANKQATTIKPVNTERNQFCIIFFNHVMPLEQRGLEPSSRKGTVRALADVGLGWRGA